MRKNPYISGLKEQLMYLTVLWVTVWSGPRSSGTGPPPTPAAGCRGLGAAQAGGWALPCVAGSSLFTKWQDSIHKSRGMQKPLRKSPNIETPVLTKITRPLFKGWRIRLHIVLRRAAKIAAI